MNVFKKCVLFMSCVLLSSCVEEPFGDVADVVKKDVKRDRGTITISIKGDVRVLARKNNYKIYGSISTHSLNTKKLECSNVFARHLPRLDMSRDEKQLYSAGWVPIPDVAKISYRRQGDAVIVGIDGSLREIRCDLPSLNDQIKVHVHFLGDPMPFGSSDEGMLGLDLLVPPLTSIDEGGPKT
jgi:hypothetical protein